MPKRERDSEGRRSSSRRRRSPSPSDSDGASDSSGSPRRSRSRSRSRHRRRSRRRDIPSSSSDASKYQASDSGSDSGGRRRRRSDSRRRGSITEQIVEYMAKKARKKAEKVAKKIKANAVSVYPNDSNPFGDSNLTENFVWRNKVERDVSQGQKVDISVKAEKKKQRERMAEIEKVKKRREERAIEKAQHEEEMVLLARERARAEFQDWEKAASRKAASVQAPVPSSDNDSETESFLREMAAKDKGQSSRQAHESEEATESDEDGSYSHGQEESNEEMGEAEEQTINLKLIPSDDYAILRQPNQFLQPRTATDPRFHTMFQQDVFFQMYSHHRHFTDHKCVDWQHIDSLDQFTGAYQLFYSAGLHDIVSLKCDYNEDVIRQFYATVYISSDFNFMTWMTGQERLGSTKNEFELALRTESGDLRKYTPDKHSRHMLGPSIMIQM